MCKKREEELVVCKLHIRNLFITQQQTRQTDRRVEAKWMSANFVLNCDCVGCILQGSQSYLDNLIWTDRLQIKIDKIVPDWSESEFRSTVESIYLTRSIQTGQSDKRLIGKIIFRTKIQSHPFSAGGFVFLPASSQHFNQQCTPFMNSTYSNCWGIVNNTGKKWRKGIYEGKIKMKKREMNQSIFVFSKKHFYPTNNKIKHYFFGKFRSILSDKIVPDWSDSDRFFRNIWSDRWKSSQIWFRSIKTVRSHLKR